MRFCNVAKLIGIINTYWMFWKLIKMLLIFFLFCSSLPCLTYSKNTKLSLFIRNRNLLEQHMHCHRQIVSIKVFKCIEKNCLFNGRSAGELRIHQSTHLAAKNYHCDADGCDYKTKTNALLKRYETITLP